MYGTRDKPIEIIEIILKKLYLIENIFNFFVHLSTKEKLIFSILLCTVLLLYIFIFIDYNVYDVYR